MKVKSITLSLIAAFVLPALTHAEPEGPKPPNFQKLLKHLDTDGDQQISKAEAEAAKRGRLAEHFDRIDADGNGFITREELGKQHKKMKEKAGEQRGKWKELDTDQSGGLSYEEVEASGHERMLKGFAMIDADDDGEITPKELRQAKQKKSKGPGSEE